MTAMDITIPAFVPRGLATMTSPRDLKGVQYSKEEHLRDAMATFWWLNGWSVRTEVRVPDCGRIDVLAELNRSTVVIELKKAIMTPTAARQAFQQAHAYAAYLWAEDARPISTLVTAGDFDVTALQGAERAYPTVTFVDFMGVVRQSYAPYSWLDIDKADVRDAARIAGYRSAQLEELASAARGAAVTATRHCEDRAFLEVVS